MGDITRYAKGATISEKELLQELHIKDWRHMTKDKVVGFVNSLPYLDPEVAKAALNQFPKFSEMGTQVVKVLSESLSSVTVSGDKADERAYQINKAVLDGLLKELDKPVITKAERQRIIDAIIQVSNNSTTLEREHKTFLSGLYKMITAVATALVAIAGAILGVNLIKKKR